MQKVTIYPVRKAEPKSFQFKYGFLLLLITALVGYNVIDGKEVIADKVEVTNCDRQYKQLMEIHQDKNKVWELIQSGYKKSRDGDNDGTICDIYNPNL